MLPEQSTNDEFLATQYAFAQYIRDPDQKNTTTSSLLSDIEPRRLKVYSELFYNNIESFASQNFPVLHSVTPEQLWHQMIRLFMQTHRCQSPIFAEIGREFIRFLESTAFQQSALFPLFADFSLELAYYEWMELVLSIDQHHIDWPKQKQVDISALLSQHINVSSLSKLGVFTYPVQHISDDFIPQAEDKKETFLLLYRDRQHQINFLCLAPVAAQLYQQLTEQEKEHQETEAILYNLHEQLNFQHWDEFKQAGLEIIEDWLQKDILYRYTGNH